MGRVIAVVAAFVLVACAANDRLQSEAEQMVDDMWSNVDTDKDGGLSRAELKQVLDAMNAHEREQGSKETDGFAGMDADGDGSVSRAELVASFAASMAEHTAHAKESHERTKKKAEAKLAKVNAAYAAKSETQKMFEALDKSKNGKISKKELTAFIMKAGDAMSAPDPDGLFARLDKDRDGSISKSEAQPFLQDLVSAGEAEEDDDDDEDDEPPPPPPPKRKKKKRASSSKEEV